MVGFRVVVAMVAALAACGVETGESAQPVQAPPPTILGGVISVTMSGITPGVASNGSSFLVVWDDGDDIRGARVSATGSILDAVPLAIGTAGGRQCVPAVASNGTDYYVVWVDQCVLRDDAYRTGAAIAGVRVTSDGAVGTPISIAAANTEDSPHIASNGTGYLVAWHMAAPGVDDVLGQLLAHDGTATGTTLAIAATAGVTELDPSVGSLGGNYLVAWSDYRDLMHYDLYARRVSATGDSSDGRGFVVSNALNDQTTSAIASNGTSYIALWEDTRTDESSMIDLWSAVIASDTTVSTAFNVVDAQNHQIDPAVISNGYDYFTAWQDNRGGTADIFGVAIANATSSVPDGFAITNNASTQERHPAIGYSGVANGYLLAYQVSDGVDLAQRIDARLIQQCGDNTIQAGEQCDDGNLVSGDGCSATCTLEAGFTCSGNPSSCADIDECLTNNGGCSQVCSNTAGSFSCGCNAGYALGADQIACTDIDECATANGGCGQTCANSAGSYTCSCSAGFALAADGHACADIDECSTNLGGCQQACTNSSGGYACACNAGFTLDGDGVHCTDIDECATANGGCSDVCTNTAGGYACSCSPTEGLASDGVTCMACRAGFLGDGTTCADIDECAAETDTCTSDQSCTNTAGSFTCASSGGCNASGGASSAWFALGLLALAFRKRR